MNIELPKNFTYEAVKGKRYGYAYVNSRNILIIKGNVSYSRIMHKITYELKDIKFCPYCGKSLEGEKVTLDHIIPVDRGGLTIPDNLIPCCADCNVDKGNMLAEEYQNYKLLETEKERYEYLTQLKQSWEKIKFNQGIDILEEDLINSRNIDILLDINFRENWKKAKKYQKVKKSYRIYKHLLYPVIVDRNNVLLDGFYTLLFAKKKGISNVPIAKLYNVEKRL